MGLTWNEKQRDAYALLSQGVAVKDIHAEKGYTIDLVKKIQKAIKHGDSPPVGTPGDGTETPAGIPIFKATTRALSESLDPIIIMRWDSVRYALNEDNKGYPLSRFIDEATDLAASLVGAVPPGFEREVEEETKVPVAVGVPAKEEEDVRRAAEADQQAKDSDRTRESEESGGDTEGGKGAPGDAGRKPGSAEQAGGGQPNNLEVDR